MRATEAKLVVKSRSDPVKIVFFGDLHLGNENTDEALIKHVAERLREPNTYWVDLGDACLPLDAQILTKRGFVCYDELIVGEPVLAFDGTHTTWVPLEGVLVLESAKQVRLWSKSFEITCTEDHGWWVDDAHKDRYKGQRKKRAASWPRKIKTRNLKKHHKVIISASCIDAGTLDITPEEAALIGWIVTDGTLVVRSPKSFMASISQAKEPYRSQIRIRFADWFTAEYIYESQPGPHGSSNKWAELSVFNISIGRLRALFKRANLKPSRFKEQMPAFVTRLSPASRKDMLQAMLKAEGWREGAGWRFSQKPGPVLDAFYILATLCGYRLGLGSFNVDGVKQVPVIESHHHVYASNIKTESVGEGPAWCPETRLGSWVVRYNRQVTITGNCEFINMRDPRFDPDTLPGWVELEDLVDLPKAQVRRYAELFKPRVKTCLARLCGNHEDTLRRKYERDVYQELNASIGLPRKKALGFSGFLRLRICREKDRNHFTLMCFLHHGAGGGMLAGAKALRLERLPTSFDADIYVVGHTHTKIALHKRRIGLRPRGLDIVDKDLVLINVGAFMRGERSGYAERRGLYPQAMGPVEVWIWPCKNGEQVLKVMT